MDTQVKIPKAHQKQTKSAQKHTKRRRRCLRLRVCLFFFYFLFFLEDVKIRHHRGVDMDFHTWTLI